MENQDSKKYHQFNGQKKLMYTLILLVLAILGSFTFYRYYVFAINRPAQGHKEAEFEIKSGQGISEIASDLYAEQLINSEFLFKVYLVAHGLQSDVQAGVYKVLAGSSIVELVDMFQYGVNDVKITFLEGWRIEEFAREADKKLDNVGYREFVQSASKSEGYLFPDTYFFKVDAETSDVISLVKDTFNEKMEDTLTEEALERAGMTKGEVMILASIVEREVFMKEDRPVVAGILVRRWRNGQRLDADATTQYAVAGYQLCPKLEGEAATMYWGLECSPSQEKIMAVDWWPAALTQEDLDDRNLYNTRNNVGLPPNPISNPSLLSIKAVLNYRETDYNYYLTDEEGVTYYARTLEEHSLNIQRFLD